MNQIKYVVADCDGSLTDGGIYMLFTGLRARKFSTFDGEGFNLLKQQGVESCIVSKSNDYEIQLRANWLGIRCYLGIANKLDWVCNLAEYMSNLDSIAYFGNDINDLSAMKVCGFSGCPSDAHQDVIDYCIGPTPWLIDGGLVVGVNSSGIVSSRKGGEGAFREFADWLIGNSFSVGDAPRDI